MKQQMAMFLKTMGMQVNAKRPSFFEDGTSTSRSPSKSPRSDGSRPPMPFGGSPHKPNNFTMQPSAKVDGYAEGSATLDQQSKDIAATKLRAINCESQLTEVKSLLLGIQSDIQALTRKVDS